MVFEDPFQPSAARESVNYSLGMFFAYFHFTRLYYLSQNFYINFVFLLCFLHEVSPHFCPFWRVCLALFSQNLSSLSDTVLIVFPSDMQWKLLPGFMVLRLLFYFLQRAATRVASS